MRIADLGDLDVVTLGGAIEATGRSKRTIQRWISAGGIRKFDIGGVKLYALDDIVKVHIAKDDTIENPIPNRHAVPQVAQQVSHVAQ